MKFFLPFAAAAAVLSSTLFTTEASAQEAPPQPSNMPVPGTTAPQPAHQELGPLGVAGIVIGGVGAAGVVVGGLMVLYTLGVEPCTTEAMCEGDRTTFYTGLAIGLAGLGVAIPGLVMLGVDAENTSQKPVMRAAVPDVYVGPTGGALRWTF